MLLVCALNDRRLTAGLSELGRRDVTEGTLNHPHGDGDRDRNNALNRGALTRRTPQHTSSESLLTVAAMLEGTESRT